MLKYDPVKQYFLLQQLVCIGWFCMSFGYRSLECHLILQCMNLYLLYAFSKLNIPIVSALWSSMSHPTAKSRRETNCLECTVASQFWIVLKGEVWTTGLATLIISCKLEASSLEEYRWKDLKGFRVIVVQVAIIFIKHLEFFLLVLQPSPCSFNLLKKENLRVSPWSLMPCLEVFQVLFRYKSLYRLSTKMFYNK